jgi:hypothetical protein
MNRAVVKSSCAVLIAIAVTAAASSKLYAIDSKNRYFAYGLGQRTCEDYIKLREKRLDTLEKRHERFAKEDLYEIVDKVVEHWIAGFLTAHNLYVSDTYDIAGKTTMEEIKARLEAACRKNPKQFFAEAMISVVQELNPQRVKTSTAK